MYRVVQLLQEAAPSNEKRRVFVEWACRTSRAVRCCGQLMGTERKHFRARSIRMAKAKQKMTSIENFVGTFSKAFTRVRHAYCPNIDPAKRSADMSARRLALPQRFELPKRRTTTVYVSIAK